MSSPIQQVTCKTPSTNQSSDRQSIPSILNQVCLQLRSRLLREGWPEINLRLAVLASVAYHTITLPPHDAFHLPHCFTQVYNLALHQDRGPLRRRSQVGAVQRPRNMPGVPETLARDSGDGHGCADVEYQGYGATMEIGACVAEGSGNYEFEGRVAFVGILGISGRGHEG